MNKTMVDDSTNPIYYSTVTSNIDKVPGESKKVKKKKKNKKKKKLYKDFMRSMMTPLKSEAQARKEYNNKLKKNLGGGTFSKVDKI